jgi:hypothetical protein
MLGLAIYLKTLPIVFLPVFLLLARTSKKTRLGYSLFSLIMPVAGTLVPAQVFNWGYQGVYNNISFQVAIPVSGAFSALGLVYLASPIPSIGHSLIGSIWIPVLLVTYFYIWKRNIPLVQGLIITILAFSMSRPFLTEQYSLYPLAFLLLVQTRENFGHFLGLAASATAFLIVNNTLLVSFFTPISTSAFNWELIINGQPPYATLRVVMLSLLALLYFTESFLVIRGRESFVHRVIVFVKPAWSLQKTTYLSHRGWFGLRMKILLAVPVAETVRIDYPLASLGQPVRLTPLWPTLLPRNVSSLITRVLVSPVT